MSTQGINDKVIHYLSQYVQKTLGVSQILNQYPEDHSSEADLGFFIEAYNTYSVDEVELLSKIISAMKIDAFQYQIYDLSEASSSKNRLQIYFVDQPKNKNEIFSPRILLKKPEFKKQTWDFLKTVPHQL